MKRNRFQSSAYGSVYTCCVCGKRTRETGNCESDLELCAYCYEISGLENSYVDGATKGEELVTRLASIFAQYKRCDSLEEIPADVVTEAATRAGLSSV